MEAILDKQLGEQFCPMNDAFFKALVRSREARAMMSSILHDLTNIPKTTLLHAEYFGGEIPKSNITEKGQISDIIIKVSNSLILVLEMNRCRTNAIFKKNTRYANSIQSQYTKVGTDIYPKVILININNFSFYSSKSAIQYFDVDDQNGIKESEDSYNSIHLVLDNIIDSRYNEGVSENVIRFAKLLKAKSLTELKNIAKGDEEFMKAVEKCESLTRDEELIGYYDLEEAHQAELREIKADGIEEGRAEGRQEGIEEGRQEGMAKGMAKGRVEERKNFVSRLLQSLPLKEVAKLTQMSEAEIKHIMTL